MIQLIKSVVLEFISGFLPTLVLPVELKDGVFSLPCFLALQLDEIK